MVQGDRTALFERYTSTHFGEHQPDFEVSRRMYALNFEALLPASLDARILDIGCGMGLMLRFLRERGYRRTEGTEVSDEQIEYCRKSGLEGVRKIESIPLDLEGRKASYDLIVMTDVLEHIPKHEVVPILTAIRQGLKSGGLAIFKVPNVAAFSGVYRRYMDFTHEVGFSEMSMRQVLNIAGFERCSVRAERSAFRSPWKGRLLSAGRGVIHGAMRVAMFIECPGDDNPKILTKNLVGIGWAEDS